MIDVTDIMTRAEEAFERLDKAQEELKLAQVSVNHLCREYSLATRTYFFKDYMLRKEVNSWMGRRCA